MKKKFAFVLFLFLFFSNNIIYSEDNLETSIITINTKEIDNLKQNQNLIKTENQLSYKKQSSDGNLTKKIFLIDKNKKEQNSKLDLDTKNIQFLLNFRSTYKVKSGDTLGLIAKKFGIAQGEIKILNPEVDFSTLPIGKELVMPISQDKIDEIEANDQKSLLKTEFKIDESITFATKVKTLRVTATAYTSRVNQTSKNPFIGAWGHIFSPEMKIVAVSDDLIKEYGIKNGTKIKISGLEGYYTVRDKMNKRFKKRIDIYMGLDIKKALQWGKRSVIIYW